jgi:hypothetical protein
MTEQEFLRELQISLEYIAISNEKMLKNLQELNRYVGYLDPHILEDMDKTLEQINI